MALTFREKKVNKDIKKKIAVLLAVFVVSLVFFEFILNYEKHVSTEPVSDSSFPVLATSCAGREVNYMYGYVNEMDPALIAGPETPVPQDTVDVTLYTYGSDIKDTSYSLLTIETQEVVDKGKISFDGTDDIKKGSINLKGKMNNGQQYFLVMSLKCKDQKVRYYSRLVSGSSEGIGACMDFAQSLHNAAIEKDRDRLAPYMEPNGVQGDNSLWHVTIESSLYNIMYNGMEIKSGDDLAYTINEYLNGNMEVTLTSTVVEIENPLKRYNVTEYIKVKYTKQRMYLASYERRMEQVYKTTAVSVKRDRLNLGIVGRDLNFLSNETGTIVAFSTNGNLYEYNQNNNTVTTVFSFGKDNSQASYHNNYQGHGIKILNIDEGGSVNFVVYGYMNTGSHAGDNGIGYYHYDDGAKVTKEDFFVSAPMSYQYMNAEYSNSVYKSSADKYYLMAEGSLHEMDPLGGSDNILLKNMEKSQSVVSNNGRFISWIDNPAGSEVMHTMDMEHGQQFDLKSDDGDYIFPLAYMNQDLIYGKAKPTDVRANLDGTYMPLMYEIFIADVSEGKINVEKNYPQNGAYVNELIKDGSSIILKRVAVTEEGISDAGQDVIKDTVEESKKTVELKTFADDKAGRLQSFVMAKEASSNKIAGAESRVSMTVGNDTFALSKPNLKGRYMIVRGDEIVMIDSDLVKCIQTADKTDATVLDDRQKTVWAKSRKDYTSRIEVNSKDMEEMTNLSRPGVQYLDLSSCTMKQMLFYVSNGYPVYTETKNGSYLIIGYDSYAATVYDPKTGGYQELVRSNLERQIEANGNIFKTYID